MRMVKNTTRRTTLSDNYRVLVSKWSQALGLMLSLNKNKSMVFNFKDERRVALHMLFVFYPIDVLFLDASKKIVEIKEGFRPFTFYTSESDKIKYVVELPKNAINCSKTKLNDKIEF